YGVDSGSAATQYAVTWPWLLMNSSFTSFDNKGLLPSARNLANTPYPPTVYQCPSNPMTQGYWREPNYAYSIWLGRIVGVSWGVTSWKTSLSRIDQPTRTVMMVDAGYRADWPGNMNGPTKYCQWSVADPNTLGVSDVNYDVHPGGKANFLMVDGHVES